eukprot:scaffold76661_cov19-Tisochrysis_lutea.AAC.1
MSGAWRESARSAARASSRPPTRGEPLSPPRSALPTRAICESARLLCGSGSGGHGTLSQSLRVRGDFIHI